MFRNTPKRDELQVNKNSTLKKLDAHIVAEVKDQMRRRVASTKTNKTPTYLTGPNDHKNCTRNAAIITHQKNINPPHIVSTSPQVACNNYGDAGATEEKDQMRRTVASTKTNKTPTYLTGPNDHKNCTRNAAIITHQKNNPPHIVSTSPQVACNNYGDAGATEEKDQMRRTVASTKTNKTPTYLTGPNDHKNCTRNAAIITHQKNNPPHIVSTSPQVACNNYGDAGATEEKDQMRRTVASTKTNKTPTYLTGPNDHKNCTRNAAIITHQKNNPPHIVSTSPQVACNNYGDAGATEEKDQMRRTVASTKTNKTPTYLTGPNDHKNCTRNAAIITHQKNNPPHIVSTSPQVACNNYGDAGATEEKDQMRRTVASTKTNKTPTYLTGPNDHKNCTRNAAIITHQKNNPPHIVSTSPQVACNNYGDAGATEEKDQMRRTVASTKTNKTPTYLTGPNDHKNCTRNAAIITHQKNNPPHIVSTSPQVACNNYGDAGATEEKDQMRRTVASTKTNKTPTYLTGPNDHKNCTRNAAIITHQKNNPPHIVSTSPQVACNNYGDAGATEEKDQMRRTVASTKTNKTPTYLTGPNDHKNCTRNAAIITHQKNNPPHIVSTSPQVACNNYGDAGATEEKDQMRRTVASTKTNKTPTYLTGPNDHKNCTRNAAIITHQKNNPPHIVSTSPQVACNNYGDAGATEEKDQMRRTVASTKTNKTPTYLTGPNDHKNCTRNAAIITHQKNNPPHIVSTSPQVACNNYGDAGAIPKQNQIISHQQQDATYHSVQPINGKQIQTSPKNNFTRASLQSECNPKVEFHNLKRQTNSRNVSTVSLLSTTPNGEACGRDSTHSFKKVDRSHDKNIFNSEQDDDKTVVDLSSLSILQDWKESSPVVSLFFCFYKLHKVLAEVSPSIQLCDDSAYEPKIVMPVTLNVRYQIEYAARKVNEIFSDLEEKNRMYKELHQCLLNQHEEVFHFDMYQGLELEHKGGEFVTKNMRVYAEGLEIVLERLTKSLSEVHLRIVAFNSDIGKKYHNGKYVRGTVEHPKRNFDTKAKKHLKFGIENVPVGEDTLNGNNNSTGDIQCKKPINKNNKQINKIY